jgi:hypothetical protein
MSTAAASPIAKIAGKWVFADFFYLNNNIIHDSSLISNKENKPDDPTELSKTLSNVNLNNVENITKKSKKKPKKRNKKPKNETQVRFSEVEISFFQRDVAFSSIPSSGSWPLGMAMSRESVEVYKLDEYETIMAQSKHKRNHDEHKHNNHENPINTDIAKDEVDIIELESRMSMFPNMSELVEDSNIRLFNQEVDMIQKSRKSDKGCNCKPLKVDKLSIPKLKSELIKAGLNSNEINDLNKNQLIKKLKDHLKGRSCQICIDITCPCFTEEHNCNASICDCLKKATKMETSCSNPFGKFICDVVRVQSYRDKYIVKQERKQTAQATVAIKKQSTLIA